MNSDESQGLDLQNSSDRIAPAQAPELAPVEAANENDLPLQEDGDILPVMGLGGSAGSIRPLQDFFARVRPDLGIAYVVVIHLAPEHESALADIIGAHTSMPVVQVQGTVEVLPNHVYVIPPSHHLTMQDGTISLTSPQQEPGQRVAVDLFFRTLAISHRSRALAVVLSGMDSDGAIGVKRIKEAGGVTIVQDPEEAEYEGMPRSAIETGMVDWILPVNLIADKVAQWIGNENRIQLPARREEIESPADPDEVALHEILSFLQARTGHDFIHYKRATVLRRIGRRLQVNSLASFPEYINFLRTHPGEAGALLQDLLISVTNFFRDPEAFVALETFLPSLFRNRNPNDPVRIWVAGCATGEEAYSLAMLIDEYASTIDSAPEVQIFATDLDEQALRFAREGVYPAAISADVSPERLRRFFVYDQGRYRVKKEVRERILFAPHNVLQDAPFSRIDLVSCRNLLIYFNRQAQERVLQVFHFALKPNGLLFLGGSESADESLLFVVQDKTHRIYERQAVSRAPIMLPNMLIPPLPRQIDVVQPAYLPPPTAPVAPRSHIQPLSYGELHLKLLEQAAPPSILVDTNYDIVHLSEHAGQFLRLVGGQASMNLLAMVPPELRVELRVALFRAVQSGEEVVLPPLSVEIDGRSRHLRLRVRPMREDERQSDISNFLLVIFEENALALPPASGEDAPAVASASDQNEVVRSLEAELEYLRDYLRASVERYETSAEELKASNEELQAMNEEQRSAAEELETSREEIQAGNEELSTVNAELKSKIEELARSNSDLQNLIAATDIATVFLSRELYIKRYTPPAAELFHFIPTDTGRPFTDLKHDFNEERFAEDALHVLRTLVPLEREVRTRDGRWFLSRTSPYRTQEDRIDGVVLNLVGITERKEAEVLLHQSESHLRLILESAKDYAIFTLDMERHVTGWNPGAQAVFGYSEAEILGRSGDIVFVPEDRAEGTPQQETEKATREGRAENERWHLRKDGSRFYGSGLTMPLRNDSEIIGFVKIMRDLTERKEAEDALQRAHDDLEKRVQERTQELGEALRLARAEMQERRQLEEARRELMRRIVNTQEGERGRISRELHDNLGQHLTAVMLGLQSLESQITAITGGQRQSEVPQLGNLRELVDALMRAAHDQARSLRPAELDAMGLAAALGQYTRDWSQRTEVEVDFQSSGWNERPNIEVETTLYRVAQEALTNVARHAGATLVSVILERDENMATLIVEDNGHGFDPDQNTARLGVLGMRERLALVGGTLDIESVPGDGTTLFARVPLTPVSQS